jgi:ammonia channel protein AmtB
MKFHYKIGVFSIMLSIPFFVMFALVNVDFISVSMQEKIKIYEYCMIFPILFVSVFLFFWLMQAIKDDIDKIEK